MIQSATQLLINILQKLTDGIIASPPAMTIGTPVAGNTNGGVALNGGDPLPCSSVYLQNSHATNAMLWGKQSTEFFSLAGGASISIPCTDASDIRVMDGPDGMVDFAWVPIIAAE